MATRQPLPSWQSMFPQWARDTPYAVPVLVAVLVLAHLLVFWWTFRALNAQSRALAAKHKRE